MGLVEDDHVVFGQHRAAAGQVRAVEVRVDDHDVGRRRPVAGGLGEAAPAFGAVERSGALAGADAHHVPRPVGGLKAQVGPVTAAGLLRPADQPPDLLDQTFRRGAIVGTAGRRHIRVPARPIGGVSLVGPARRLVAELSLDPARPHLGHPLAADVVAAALQHGEVERHGQAEA